MPRPLDAAQTQGGGRGTFRSSVATLSAWAMGCGVLSLPRVFALCGTFWSLTFLTAFAGCIDLSLRWVLACGRYSGRVSFKDNARFFIGPLGASIVHVGQIVLLFGGIVAVYITVASLMPCILRDFFEQFCAPDTEADMPSSALFLCSAYPFPCIPRTQLLVLVTALVFPLACQDSLHSLRCFSGIGLGCFGYFFLVLLLRLGRSLAEAPSSSGEGESLDIADASGQSSFWQGPPIVLMAFLCHTSILQLDNELQPTEKSQVAKVVRTVIVQIALPVYALIGLGGFLLHGRRVSSNVLDDFGGDIWMAAARLLLGFMNMVKIPLAAVTLREALISSLPSLRLRRRLQTPFGRMAATAVVLLSSMAAAICLGSLSHVLSLLGCTVGVCFSLCLPAALYWQLLSRVSADRRGAARGLAEPLLGNADCHGTASIKGILELPSSPEAVLLHRAACLAMLLGGAAMGGLGLVSWMRGDTS